MKGLQKVLLTLGCALLLNGCYEDESEITLNADGSGTIKQAIVASERLIVATSEDGGNKNTPPISKQQILEKVGTAVDVTSIQQTELPDGGRKIEFEGTFSNPEQFFLSEFCSDTLKLRLAPAVEGKAVIYWDSEPSDASAGGPSIAQLYGMAKGLYIKRTIHLPGSIEKTNGHIDNDKKTVSWVSDLRDKQGLARTKAFMEGPGKGIGSVVFDASVLKFSLPLKMAASTQKTTETEGKKPSKEDLKAEVSWIGVTKKATLGNNSKTTEISGLELGIKVAWDKNDAPYACLTPVLTSIQDNAGNDLVQSGYEHTYKTSGTLSESILKIKPKCPANDAQAIKNITGFVPVIKSVNEEKAVLENIHTLIGKESTGNSVLDNLHIQVKEITGSRLVIEIDGGHNTITSLKIISNNGNVLKHIGGGGWGNNYTYDFADEISEGDRCELEVIVSKTTVKVPFSSEEIELP